MLQGFILTSLLVLRIHICLAAETSHTYPLCISLHLFCQPHLPITHISSLGTIQSIYYHIYYPDNLTFHIGFIDLIHRLSHIIAVLCQIVRLVSVLYRFADADL